MASHIDKMLFPLSMRMTWDNASFANASANPKGVVLHCSACGRRVHWVAGPGVTPGHWTLGEQPAPHGEPVVQPNGRRAAQALDAVPW
jgi:hypothetical protein